MEIKRAMSTFSETFAKQFNLNFFPDFSIKHVFRWFLGEQSDNVGSEIWQIKIKLMTSNTKPKMGIDNAFHIFKFGSQIHLLPGQRTCKTYWLCDVHNFNIRHEWEDCRISQSVKKKKNFHKSVPQWPADLRAPTFGKSLTSFLRAFSSFSRLPPRLLNLLGSAARFCKSDQILID